jgi:hypothetical protein
MRVQGVECNPHTFDFDHYLQVPPWQLQRLDALTGFEPWSLLKNSSFLIIGSNTFGREAFYNQRREV